MNDKKNIDRLFQEKFKDFEAVPDAQVWLNIETALKEKKRKAIPFWLRLSGIAAALLLGFYTLNMMFNSTTKTKNTIVLDPKNESQNKDSISNRKQNKNIALPIKNKQELVITNPKTIRNHEKENSSTIQTVTEQAKNKTNTPVYKSKNNSSIKTDTTPNFNIKSETIVVEKKQLQKANSSFVSFDLKSEKESVAKIPDTKIAATDTKNEDKAVGENKNELEEILKMKEKKTTAALKNKNRWQIVPNVAPVYLNSNSAGSAIDPQFSDNTKTTDNNFSYGVGVNYAVSKKLTVRTGVNKLSLGYNTNNVTYSTSLVTNNLENITYSSNESIEIKNAITITSQGNLEKAIQNIDSGVINQKMGYYEVPLELSYVLIKKKFGVSVIGGISTLFLNQNKISLRSNRTDLRLGEANNLNAIHFSTNLGMGFKYQFVKSFQINIEPMVKYQLNTFTNNSSTYKPVFIGLYSGVIYSF